MRRKHAPSVLTCALMQPKHNTAPLARAHAFGNTLALHAHTARQNKKTHAPHRKQTRHTATRYANATPCTHELDSAAHGVATRERERENPKRKSNKTAAARCVQRCCCAVRVVRYRLRGHEALTVRFFKIWNVWSDQATRRVRLFDSRY